MAVLGSHQTAEAGGARSRRAPEARDVDELSEDLHWGRQILCRWGAAIHRSV